MLSSLCIMLNTLVVMLLTVFCQMLRMRMCRAAPSIVVRAPRRPGGPPFRHRPAPGPASVLCNQVPNQESRHNTKKFKNRTCVTSHTKQPRCVDTLSLSREASPGTLGDKANPRTVAPSTPRWQTHKTGSFVIQIFSWHCAVQKTKQPRHVDTPALHREASPLGPSVTTPAREPPHPTSRGGKHTKQAA